MQQEELDQIVAHVQFELKSRVREFRLNHHREGVVLRGRVTTYYAKQLAQHAVMRATTLPILRNEIEVS